MASSKDNIYQFQELVRTIDATIEKINPRGSSTGTNTMRTIEFLYKCPGMREFIGTPYDKFISHQIVSSAGKNYKRDEAVRVLLYPRTDILPYDNVDMADEVIEKINSEIARATFTITCIKGKLILTECLNSNVKTMSVLTRELADDLDDEWEKEISRPQMTIVRRKVLFDLDGKKVSQFVRNFESENGSTFRDIRVKSVKGTFAEEWSTYGRCMMVQISSPQTEKFILSFNKTFKTQVTLDPHIVFATVPRALWGKLESRTHTS